MAKRFSKPFTFVGILLNFWSNASEILCAGSVDMMSTFSLTFDNCTANEQLKTTREEMTENNLINRRNFEVRAVPARRFANSAFATDEYPSQGSLFDYVLDRRLVFDHFSVVYAHVRQAARNRTLDFNTSFTIVTMSLVYVLPTKRQ